MNVQGVFLIASPAILTLTQCSEVGTPVSSPAAPTKVEEKAVATKPSAPASLTLRKSEQSVIVENNGKRVSVCRADKPNVEVYKFYKNKTQVVVKSRGNHGPAIVELFDSQTGVRRGHVMAYEISSGQPEWAKGMKE